MKGKALKLFQSIVIMDWVIYSKMSLMLRVVLVSFFRVGFLTAAYLTVANLVQLGIPISVRSQYLLRLLLDCRWLHSTPTYWKTVAANWYRIHTILKFCHESSWITWTCHNTRRWVGLQRKIKLQRAKFMRLSSKEKWSKAVKFKSLSA